MSPVADVAIVGAGPAGLSGAVTAADAGCQVTVLDLAERPGGQYWRHPADTLGTGPRGLHHGWAAFAALRDRFAAHAASGRISYLPGHAVWRLDCDEQGVIARATAGERAPEPVTVRARMALVATGAHDRHVPFPGWTLPGVVAVGGAQALLKGNLITPGRRIVVAGTGPFLLSAADGLLRAGAEVPAIVEAAGAGGAAAWLRGARRGRGRGLPAVPAKLREAAGYAVTLARRRVPYLTGQAVVQAHGPERVQAVSVRSVAADWAPRPGPERRIECDTLAVGFGFVPQLELLMQAGCETRQDRTGMLVATVDSDQRTSVADVYAAGEPTGVGGAELAVAEGALAGDAIARALGRGDGLDDRGRARLRSRRARLISFGLMLAEVHPVPDGWRAWSTPETPVCRCEDVTIGEISSAVALGAGDARAVKLLARPGMGRCQGRICGAAVASLVAGLNSRAVTADDLRGLAERPFAQPVALGTLARQQDGRS